MTGDHEWGHPGTLHRYLKKSSDKVTLVGQDGRFWIRLSVTMGLGS